MLNKYNLDIITRGTNENIQNYNDVIQVLAYSLDKSYCEIKNQINVLNIKNDTVYNNYLFYKIGICIFKYTNKEWIKTDKQSISHFYRSNKKGKYLVLTSKGHLAYINNNFLYCSWNCSRKFIEYYIEL